MSSAPFTIMHFSDVLCVWAYLAQIRIDELNSQFGDKVHLDYHFIPIFGSVEEKLEKGWGHRGGIPAYAEHVQSVVSDFDHITVNHDAWTTTVPTSSSSVHLFLKAVQLLEKRGDLAESPPRNAANRTLLEQLTWDLRVAFFQEAIDISNHKAQLEIAEALNLPIAAIEAELDSGAAFAELNKDLVLRDTYHVAGSPTLVFNEGRQTLYGNVGYRVIEANIQELLEHSDVRASWC